MAIWQFKVDLLPALSVSKLELDGSVFLEDYFIGEGPPEYDEDKEFKNYWDGYDPSIYKDELAALFGTERENWGDGLIFGKKGETIAEVWNYALSIRLDMNNFNNILCDEIVKFAKKNELVFVFNETGRLHTPSFPVLIENIRNSRAFRFIKNPKAAIVEAGNYFKAKNLD